MLIGIVEDHGRERTRKLTEGLPTLPRKSVPYRGGHYEELDLEAALEAHPEIVLVDELAHTVVGENNADSSRPAEAIKRWHDVYALLDAGIDVISTMNIQHLESLNDVVSAVTGTRQLETVPDQVLRDADEIELVDLSPDALRIRLARGEVYRQQQAETALNNYFRVGNLTALRELSLLWLADKVDEGLAKYREDKKIEENWPTRERVVVAVRGDEVSEALIRRGARITQRVAGREMLVVYVSGADEALGVDLPERLRRLQELTESLDGQWRVIEGDDIANPC
ncbi:two-component system sensor kinase KdpD [Corynebacterium jeikeium]|nr:sensor histidine kinase KdpD [Corynebacterium jeikeium]SUY93653.1 two-component system sensor kinase KdpD [Corynebacterium jeikeium]